MIKQVIVIRSDLKMRRGKEIAQGSHASMQFLLQKKELTEEQKEWLSGDFTKICLKAENEEELLDIYKKAQEAKLEVHLITDLGKTEFNGIETKTCLAIGPHESNLIDPITKNLKLY